jgi:pimeloyl-ACP methyl ester carboxylesterase
MKHWITFLTAPALALLNAQSETLPPLKDGLAPQTVEEAWAGYDPRAEPIEGEIIKEWEEEGTTLRAIRYCIGTFKGQKAWMGAIYGFPTGGKDLPAIVQIHGGGGKGSKDPCIDNAKRGYATLSLSWRGDERYLTENDLPESAQTDWGAVEGRQVAESRGIEPNNDKRFDPVPSARNDGYFLRTLAARRALTFLEQQEEVDGEKLGVDGHSMGGVITLQTAAMDSRIKAAAPSCAPPLEFEDSLKVRTASPGAYAHLINVPMLFMSPSNDFHGLVEASEWIIDQMPAKDFRIARSMHVNHKHDAAALAAKQLWFDAHLKGSFPYPAQPEITVDLNATGGQPTVKIVPDSSLPIASVDIYLTRDGKLTEYATNRTRLWNFIKPEKTADLYTGRIGLHDLNEPFWVFANISYKIDQTKESPALTQESDTFTVTTRMLMFTPEQLEEADVKADGSTTQVIESFGEDWEKQWIVSAKSIETWLLNDARVPMPEYGKLVIELSTEAKTDLLVKVGNDHTAKFPLQGAGAAETIEIYPFELTDKNTGAKLLNWQDLSRPMLSLGTNQGQPAFKKVSWVEIPAAEFMAKRPFQLGEAEKIDGKIPLTFELADSSTGRIDPENKTVKLTKEEKESPYPNGLQVHSPSEQTYFLKGGFSTFSATLVPGYQASVTFEVHADGKKLYDSGNFGGQSEPKVIEVDVTGAQELKLVVTEGGNGWGGDWVMWADAAVE